MKLLTTGSPSIKGKICSSDTVYRNLKNLPNGLILTPYYSKILKNKTKGVCMNNFKMLKVIGKGGFSKVYMGTFHHKH